MTNLSPLSTNQEVSKRSNDFSGDRSNGAVLTLKELEASTIEKQRKELRILLSELKDRDRELNGMVTSHQQHLSAWETDRQRSLYMEQKLKRYESELKKRSQQIKQLIHFIKLSDTKHKSTHNQLQNVVTRMKQLEEDACISNSEAHDLKEKNDSLNDSLSDMSGRIHDLESREQKFSNVLREKEKEIYEAGEYLFALKRKVKALETEIQDRKRKEDILHSDLEEERSKSTLAKSQVAGLKRELLQSTNESRQSKRENSKFQEQVQALQSESSLKGDEIKRRDELIESLKSKLDRTDKELTSLRLVYERQHEYLYSLRLSVDDLRKTPMKQDECFDTHSDLSDFEDCRSDTTNEILEEARRTALSDINNSEADRDMDEDKLSLSSPTSKLQRLLEESREMVHNLELATKSPPNKF